jgi:hypothetical protein
MDSSEQAIKALAEQVAQVRQARKHGRGALPRAIWDRAVQLAQIHGVSEVAGQTKLNPRILQDRFEPKRTAEVGNGNANFFECLFSGNADEKTKCCIELESRCGNRMRIQGVTLNATEIQGLLRAFAR